MRTSNWDIIAHTAQQSKYKLRKKRKKSAKIRVLKEISRRLALGLELPPEAIAYAKGQIQIAPKVEAPRKQRQKTNFYLSKAWRDIRYQAIKRSKGQCEACGRSPKDGIKLHADHIKPRSKNPKLALELSNVQILCEDCNLGKSNRDTTDWRETPTNDVERAWDREAWQRLDGF